MAILVRIIIALINRVQIKSYYEYVASSVILTVSYLTHHHYSKNQKHLLENISKISKLIQMSVIGSDLWIISNIALNESPEVWAM
jgi:hypothetical protein